MDSVSTILNERREEIIHLTKKVYELKAQVELLEHEKTDALNSRHLWRKKYKELLIQCAAYSASLSGGFE